MTEGHMGKRMIPWIVVLVLLAASCSAGNGAQTGGPSVADDYTSAVQIQTGEREGICFAFMASNMLTEQGGVRTNYLDKAKNAELATGAEVLSESMGLLMLYAAEIRDEALFKRLLSFVEGYLDTGTILAYRYSPETGAYHVNAFVDDIRIIRALLEADAAFGGDYLNTALKYADRLYDTNVKDGRVYDMYDEQYGTTNDFVTLCYIDLYTIQRLSAVDSKWEAVFETMRGIVKGSYISDAFPMYAGSLSYTDMKYAIADITMVQSMLTALNLASIGECPQTTLDYLNECVKSGAIYGTYRQDGTRLSNTESTAIYAVCAMIAQAAGDDELYGMCIDLMNRFQVTDKTSEVYGAFANAQTMDLYAFDNLTALLAYRQG